MWQTRAEGRRELRVARGSHHVAQVSGIVDNVKSEWRRFASDEPGVRFERRYERLRASSVAWTIVRFLIGLVLVGAGIVLLFIPGPGLLVMLFGVAMFAGQSRRLARALDRGEPHVRRVAGSAMQRWRRTRLPVKVALVAVGIAAAIGAAYAAYHYLL
jgi:hypothetical protein